MNNEIVPPQLYNEQYYLGQGGCEGVEIFLATKGQQLSPRLQKILDEITDVEDKTILELGCGRGELALHIEDKAKYMLCVDYSKDACKIAQSILKKARVICADATVLLPTLTTLPQYPDCSVAGPYDIILMNDFIEHLYDWQLKKVFEQMFYITKKDSYIYINTPIILSCPKSVMHVNIQPTVGHISDQLRNFDLLKNMITDPAGADHLLIFKRK